MSADEREAGLRRILNFGHTAGHALEAVTNIGASGTAKRSATACWWRRSSRSRAARSPNATAGARRSDREPRSAAADRRPVRRRRSLEAMQHDKKVVAGRLHFVLPTAIGATDIVDDVSEQELAAALTAAGFAR